jgi:hypothetical protein
MTDPEDWYNIPNELKARPQWMVSKGIEDKSPLTLNGYRGDKTNPEHWCSFPEAYMLASQQRWCIGFCLSANDPFTCIDMDNKERLPEYQHDIDLMCNRLDTYIELSIGGIGRHAWLYGNTGSVHKRAPFELYSQTGFIIMTGNVLKQRPILDDQEWLRDFVSWFPLSHEIEDIPDQPPIEDNVAVCSRVMNSRYHKTFRALVNADWEREYSDPSSGDYAFAQILAEFTPSNQQIWSIFQQTPLGQRLKNGRVRHPDCTNFIRNACAKARARVAADAPMIAASAHILNVANQYAKSYGNGAGINEAAAASGAQILRPLFPGIHQKESPPDYGGIDSTELIHEAPTKWLVEGIFERVSVNMIVGGSGCGKSFLVLDLMYKVALGEDWFGVQTEQIHSAYIALEGGGSMRERVLAYGDAPYGVDIIRAPFNLSKSEDVDEFIRQRKAKQRTGGLVVIDTFAQATAGSNENDTGEMTLVLAAARKIMRELQACVIVIHHTRKDGEGYRGSSALRGDFDGILEIKPEVDEQRAIWVEKERNAKDGYQLTSFELKGVLVETLVGRDGSPKEVWNKKVVPVPGHSGTPWERGHIPAGSHAPMDGAKSEREYEKAKEKRVNWTPIFEQAWEQLKTESGLDRIDMPTLVDRMARVAEPYHKTPPAGLKKKVYAALDYLLTKGLAAKEMKGEISYVWKL